MKSLVKKCMEEEQSISIYKTEKNDEISLKK